MKIDKNKAFFYKITFLFIKPKSRNVEHAEKQFLSLGSEYASVNICAKRNCLHMAYSKGSFYAAQQQHKIFLVRKWCKCQEKKHTEYYSTELYALDEK